MGRTTGTGERIMGYSDRIQGKKQHTTIQTFPSRNKKITKKETKTPSNRSSLKKKEEKLKAEILKLIEMKKQMLIDEFKQLKTYFRKGERPSQKTGIENFEKHLTELTQNI